MATIDYDFNGYATRYDVKCADGLTIRKGAFQDCDGKTVPLVWAHQHNDVKNVLGHALLECRDDGVYMYGKFNNTEDGQHAKECVKNRDVTGLSIYANRLKRRTTDVMHGVIREVSLVLAGANPQAYIDAVVCHADDGTFEDEDAWIYSGDTDLLLHSDDEYDISDEEINEILDEINETEITGDYSDADYDYDVEHADDLTDEELASILDEIEHGDEETVQDVFDTLTDKQKGLVMALIGAAIDDSIDHSEEDMNTMYNAFDTYEDERLQHDAMEIDAAFGDAESYGSLAKSFLAHGINDLEYLFPEDKVVGPYPSLIKRDTGWVQTVMAGVKHSPFSRVRSVHANLTEDEARAKGYIKGKFKKEEFFGLLKRSTEPQTIYKKQKMDKDDISDITTIDIVAFLKQEMRWMLDEEIARAILIGDGREASDDDKIREDRIRPIAKDAELYTIQVTVNAGTNPSREDLMKQFIRAAIKSRKDYKGSGTPTLFTTEDILTEMLLLEDGIGHDLYETEEKLARKLRVSKIVTVPVMENQVGLNGGELLGIIVNLSDYNVGADKGGAISMFDDFDIDYNQYKYLIETRCSGALILPYSAIALCGPAPAPANAGGASQAPNITG